MIVTKKEIEEINKIQLDIFKEFMRVCKILNIKYFLVHGSLLGSIRNKGFFPFDDDIDVAMFRKDYDVFISKGQELLKDNLFIQNYKSEDNYPLVFTKLRNSNTTFIQPILKKCKINKGIYIDIFPIDNYPTKKCSIIRCKLLEKIFRIRQYSLYNVELTFIKKIVYMLVKIIYMNDSVFLQKFNNLYKNIPFSGKVILYGGKAKEKGIDYTIFNGFCESDFESLKVSIPLMYREYLNIIYGDYKNYDPAKKYMKDSNRVEISAEVFDIHKSYLEYDNNGIKG